MLYIQIYHDDMKNLILTLIVMSDEISLYKLIR